MHLQQIHLLPLKRTLAWAWCSGSKGPDGRIDDPRSAGRRWVWTTSGHRAEWRKEGGKGAMSKLLAD